MVSVLLVAGGFALTLDTQPSPVSAQPPASAHRALVNRYCLSCDNDRLKSPDTEVAVREVMIAAGVTPPKVVTAKTQQIYWAASATKIRHGHSQPGYHLYTCNLSPVTVRR